MMKEKKTKIIGALATNYDMRSPDFVAGHTIEDVARENAIEFLHDLYKKKRNSVSTTAVGRRYAR